jgi:SAM-dependent methyltransferase
MDLLTAAPVNAELGSRLADDGYLRERIQPRFWDLYYLAFTDLLRIIAEFGEHVEGRLFDYGCGGAPYRALFRKCAEYVGADVTPGPNVDCVLTSQGLSREMSASYDALLSTQVLEHVPDPDAYLSECRRLLKSGGQALITTHGMFVEHACPHDYQRWTARGLELLLEKHGFEVLRLCKWTTEMRGAIQLMHVLNARLRCKDRPILHALMGVVRLVYTGLGIPLGNLVGKLLARQGVVPGSAKSSVYVGVSAWVRKPGN